MTSESPAVPEPGSRLHQAELLSMEIVMDIIAQANVDRFQALLKTETDPTKRLMIIRLLAEENMKEPPQLQAKRA